MTVKEANEDARAGNQNAATLALLSQLTLAIALFQPFMAITIIDGVRRYSLVSGIVSLAQSGDWLLAFLIVGFSVAFPLVKNAFLLAATSGWLNLSRECRQKLHHVAAQAVKYSMLDVFVAAILVVVLKVSGQATVAIGSGTVLFCIAIAMSAWASSSLKS
ncbi:paraquat-inducible protein A [Lacipirellula sp.]|uniref:paraquat-inducible protein A n=1 Tax=Lacipirellula sp. TaxID=2691419 RepID=UPI003D13B531